MIAVEFFDGPADGEVVRIDGMPPMFWTIGRAESQSFSRELRPFSMTPVVHHIYERQVLAEKVDGQTHHRFIYLYRRP